MERLLRGGLDLRRDEAIDTDAPAGAGSPAGGSLEVAARTLDDGVVVLALAGELDYASAEAVERAIASIEPGSAGRVVLDLSKLLFLDSTGIRLIVMLLRRVEAAGGSLALVPGSPRVQRVLQLTRLDRRLRFVASEAALDSGEILEERLPVAPDAPTQARRFLAARIGTRVEPVLLADIQLVLSELVTNSVRHAGLGDRDTIELRITIDPQTVRIDVTDTGRGLRLEPTRDRSPDRASGWGLFLVDRIADRWGVDGHHGTRVWAEFARLRRHLREL